MRRAAHGLALLLALAALATPAAAESFERHVIRGQGISLAVPTSWVAVDSRLSAAVVNQLARENPKLAPYLRQLGQPGSPMKFVALDPVVRKSFATNVNVVVTPLASGVSFAAYRRALVAELAALGPRRLRQRVVKVRGIRALRLEYRFGITAGTRHTVQALQYAFLRPGRSVVVTYTTLPSLAGRYAGTFRRSAASIRFSS